MILGELSTAGALHVVLRKSGAMAERPRPLRKVADRRIQSMKFLLIFAVLMDLAVSAATSTTTTIRSSRSSNARSNHQYGIEVPARLETVSNLEADEPAVELLRSNGNLDGIEEDNAVQSKKLQRRRKKARRQPWEDDQAADDDSTVNDSATTAQNAAVIDEKNESVIRSSVASHPASKKNQDSDVPSEDASRHLQDAPNADAEEVVMTEEREEDKKLIPEYYLGDPIQDWDQKRKQWAREHPEVKQEQLFILTGTQPWPCSSPEGDHLLLRCFKNKVDYSRIHGVGLFYNTALLDPHMPSFWAKLPVVRATMLAHPEVEWIWWLDGDAIITDMEFSIPFHRYSEYNMVLQGWESLVFEKRNWCGLNAGSFLLRNCQWSLELMEQWASMGPKAPMGDAYYDILSDLLPDRPRSPTDDQSALVYLLIKERERWAGKLRVELDFFLSGYWLELMDGFEAVEERYRAVEEQHAELWEMLEREGAVGKEKMVAAMGGAREQILRESGTTVHERRSFITHFTGCQPCTGHHNPVYSEDQCRTGLLRALNYADDQVLRTLGYRHSALHLPHVLPASTSRATA